MSNWIFFSLIIRSTIYRLLTLPISDFLIRILLLQTGIRAKWRLPRLKKTEPALTLNCHSTANNNLIKNAAFEAFFIAAFAAIEVKLYLIEFPVGFLVQDSEPI